VLSKNISSHLVKQKLFDATRDLQKAIRQKEISQPQKSELDVLREQYKERRRLQTATHPGRRKTDKNKKKI
jgi:hypothetical protein